MIPYSGALTGVPGAGPRTVGLALFLALFGTLAVACGGGTDGNFATGGDPTSVPLPTLTPTLATGLPEPSSTPTLVSVLDPLSDLDPGSEQAPEADSSFSESPEPTPTFDPGDVILPTVVAATPEPTDLLDADLQARLDDIEPAVSALRELYAVDDTQRRFITRAELEVRLVDDLEDGREEFDEYGRLYEIMGITEPGTDLYELFLDLYSTGVLGFFDPELNELYVVGDDSSELSPQDHLTYTHEFVHVLQQQHFDIGGVMDSDELMQNSDRAAAYRALIEGDATLLGTIYMFQNMTAEEQASAQDLGVDLSSFFAAPHMVQRTFLFPYLEGAQFVLQVFAEIGWKGVNALYERAPESTEQIMHPAKYRSGEAPLEVDIPAFEDVLGQGWSELHRDTFGEFALAAYLEDRLPQNQAAVAAAGWGGDRYALYAGPGDTSLLVHRLTWDTVGDAAEFFGAFAGFSEARFGTEWDLLDGEGSAIQMVLPDRVVYAVIRGTTTDLVFAPSVDVLDLVVDALSPTSGVLEAESSTSTEPYGQARRGGQEPQGFTGSGLGLRLFIMRVL
jgi:hypothetical protein